jgi:SsrA-binding protein
MKSTTTVNIVNRKAKFDYHLEKAELAGIQLVGSEVKAIRAGHVNMTDAFCVFENEELWVRNMSITSPKNAYSHEPTRARKILLKRKELNKMEKELTKGYTIIPVRLFTNSENLIKIEVCLAKGKKQFDKRETIKERDIKREISREEKC